MNLKQDQILIPKNKYKVVKAEYAVEYHCLKCCFDTSDGCTGDSVLLTKTKMARDLCNHKTYFEEVE